MSAILEQIPDVSPLCDAVRSILGPRAFSAYRFCDNVAGEHKVYEVYQIVRDDGTFVLKQYDNPKRFETERSVYARFSPALPVPRVLGFSENAMVTAFVPGEDLKEMTDTGISAAADSAAEIMNAFPLGQDYDRTGADAEISYREKRLESLQNEPLLLTAYGQVLARLKDMPLTLANGDFLPLNCIYDGTRVYIIDWEYGGFLPYALDIGRFLAHCGEHTVFPYRMTEAQKALFCDRLYEMLTVKPERSVFDRDVRLAVFDEWIMIVSWYLRNPDEPRDETFRVYYDRAAALAKALLS
jgi:hypothetical protein